MKKPLLIASILTLSMGMLAGCVKSPDTAEEKPSTSTAEELTPFGKYEQTLTYTIGKSTPGIPKLPEGQTYEDNAYTRYLKETLNIQNVNKFEAQTGDPYTQKASMALAIGDLPDLMQVDDNTLRQLVDNDMIADLTDVYKTSVSDYVKEKYDSYDGRALEAATFDGKLMALPSTSNANIPTMLWMRKDWLDRLKLAEPKSIDDVENILTQFVQKDPGGNGSGKTVGLVLSPSIGGLYGSLFQADNIFAAQGSFPRQWIEQDGQIVYGSITEQTKDGLDLLADWYEKGLIDQQLAVRDSVESVITSGEAGAFFGPWWSADYPLNDARKNDAKADWMPYIISGDGSGTVTAYTQNPASDFYVVRKGFEHPELIGKIASALNDKLVREDLNYQPVIDFNLGGYDGGRPLNISINFNDATAQMYKDLKAAVDGEKAEDTLTLDDRTQFQKIESYLKDPDNADANAWSGYTSRMVAGKLMAETKINEVHPVFFGQTKSMKLKWANLVKLEDEAFLKILMGDEGIDYFDEFVSTWKKTGGDEITKEVAEAVKP